MNKEYFNITYYNNKDLSLEEQVKIATKIRLDIVDVLNKQDITYILADGEQVRNHLKEIDRLNNIISTIEEDIEKERMEHWSPSPLYLTELLGRIQELKEEGNNNV